VKGLREGATLASLPRLEFNVRVGMHRHRFRREMRFIHELDSPYQKVGLLSSQRTGFQSAPALKLGEDGPTQAELRTFHDARDLHLSLTVPTFDAEESKELGFTDEVQIGVARRLSATDFGRVALRLGINSDTKMATERTPNRPTGNPIKGTKTTARKESTNTVYELTVPLKVLKKLGIGAVSRFVIDLSFPSPDEEETTGPSDPKINTMSYRIRYGSDSLVPVHFVELNLSRGSR